MTSSIDPVALASRLIAGPSTTPARGEVFDVLEEALRPLGFEVHRWVMGEAPDGPTENMVAIRGSGGPHFGFAGHLDVVPPGDGWASDPFEPVIADGVLTGRGANDMKSAIAAFVTAIEDPANFRRSRSVGFRLGLTTRRYQSGQVDYDGHISRRGDRHVRSLLYEAAAVMLTRSSADSALRSWGLRLKERVGFKRAAVALARKLAVTMHAMLRSGELFDRTAGAAI